MFEITTPIKLKNTYQAVTIGIIGGIGAGKTTICKLLKEKNIKIIDADKISRTLYEKNTPLYEKIVTEFGKEILDENLEIDRKKLGQIVFNDDKKLEQLEKITHKPINEYAHKILEKQPKNTVICYESTKIIETGFHEKLDIIIYVQTDENERIKRLKNNRNINEKQIKQIISKQKTMEKYLTKANIILNNNENELELKKTVNNLITHIKNLKK